MGIGKLIAFLKEGPEIKKYNLHLNSNNNGLKPGPGTVLGNYWSASTIEAQPPDSAHLETMQTTSGLAMQVRNSRERKSARKAMDRGVALSGCHGGWHWYSSVANLSPVLPRSSFVPCTCSNNSTYLFLIPPPMLLTWGIFANRNELAKHNLGGLRLYELEAIQLPASHKARNAGVLLLNPLTQRHLCQENCAGNFFVDREVELCSLYMAVFTWTF